MFGDYLIADMDELVIPKMDEEVISDTEKVMNTESEMRKEILKGMDPEEAYLKYRKF